eukprot:TRINITY_DN1274_c0_g1_i1.p1 TRINITY_DN1274_c0_g1~~TRINITY_DN1274_c0_g1_i1.p1  ORF type:complete len:100 (+),score=0.85 TRINITY_DN1274_c0_g1_i1:108-407(+)
MSMVFSTAIDSKLNLASSFITKFNVESPTPEDLIYARRRNLYRRLNSKKHVEGNINYLDHNILSLGNRSRASSIIKATERLYESVDNLSRRKSPLLTRL